MSDPELRARVFRGVVARFLAAGFFAVVFLGVGDRATLAARFSARTVVGFAAAGAGAGAGAGTVGAATGSGCAACCTEAAAGAGVVGAADAAAPAVESFDPPNSPLMKGLAMQS